MSPRRRTETTGPRRPTALLAGGAVLGALLAAAGLTAPGVATLPPDVVALVNQSPIRTEDYVRMVEAVAGDRRAPIEDADKQRVLDRLIEEELLVQRGLTLDLPRLDRRVRADLTQTVIDGIASQADEREPSDSELQAFYDAHRDIFAGPGRLRVRQVFVRVTTPSDPAALARADQAAQRLRAGESIDAVQAALGDPPLAALPDTPLPPTKLRDYLGPTALRTALELDVGEVSDPVRSGTGYHVLQVAERQADTAPTLDEVRPQVVAEFHRQASERALRNYLDELRAGAEVKVREPLP
ncbi:MAG TPA: peptidyl-prolyl cis-trans isomerase [Candidatus Dormibacteraeota bacterium]|nr:peptidyl-prolyl cis-trans isomerase [Candidatus Dormibacteraeota bacterium]